MSVSLSHPHDAETLVEVARSKVTTATFDDIALPPDLGYVVVEDGYAKLDWSNFYACNPAEAQLYQYGRSGFFTGITSGQNVAYNHFGDPAGVSIASGTFTLDSVEMTAAWDKKLSVQIIGFDADNNVAFDQTVTLTDKRPTLEKLDFTSIVEVDFIARDGKQDPKLTGTGTQIVFDDFKFSAINGDASKAPSSAHGLPAPHQTHLQVEHLPGLAEAMHASPIYVIA